MQGFIFGLMMILGGGVVMYYNKQLEDALGRNDRAEKNLGSTYVMYVLIGFAMVIIGVLMRFGLKLGGPGDF